MCAQQVERAEGVQGSRGLRAGDPGEAQADQTGKFVGTRWVQTSPKNLQRAIPARTCLLGHRHCLLRSKQFAEKALVDVIVALSKFGESYADSLVEVDVNPLFALEDGVIAVDGVVRLVE